MRTTAGICLLAMAVPAFADTTYVEVGTPDRLNVVPFWGQTYDAFRLQWLYYSSEMGRSGHVVSVGLYGAPDAPAYFYNVRLLLCHTNLSQLTSDFAANYAGNTPAQVFSADTLLVGDGPPADWFTFPADFDYDSTSNLLVEVRWRGDAGADVAFYRRNVTHDYRRCFAYDDSASSGFVDTVPGNNIRFGFATTGVAEPVEYVEPGASMPSATLVRGSLFLPVSTLDVTPALFDHAGRAVMKLEPGTNDIGWLSPGVYFVRDARAVRKVVVQR